MWACGSSTELVDGGGDGDSAAGDRRRGTTRRAPNRCARRWRACRCACRCSSSAARCGRRRDRSTAERRRFVERHRRACWPGRRRVEAGRGEDALGRGAGAWACRRGWRTRVRAARAATRSPARTIATACIGLFDERGYTTACGSPTANSMSPDGAERHHRAEVHRLVEVVASGDGDAGRTSSGVAIGVLPWGVACGRLVVPAGPWRGRMVTRSLSITSWRSPTSVSSACAIAAPGMARIGADRPEQGRAGEAEPNATAGCRSMVRAVMRGRNR